MEALIPLAKLFLTALRYPLVTLTVLAALVLLGFILGHMKRQKSGALVPEDVEERPEGHSSAHSQDS